MNVAPGTSYETVFVSGVSGLVGTVAVGLIDNQGTTVQALSTAGIIETPAGSGVYAATKTAPLGTGQYTILWSINGTTAPDKVTGEDLVVTFTLPTPVPPVVPGATTSRQLLKRCRRFLQDWGDLEDVTTASIDATSGTLTVADSSMYGRGWVIQAEDEAMQVTGAPSGTTVSVRRAVRGTSAQAHASATPVQIRPHFLNLDYLEALNSAVEACYPWIYKPFVDETVVTSSGIYEYPIPTVDGLPVRALTRVYIRDAGTIPWAHVMKWDVVRASNTVKIKIGFDPGPASLRLIGFTQIQPLGSLDSTLDPTFPPGAEDALVFYAAQYLLASGESRRVREDTGLRDDRESRNATGSSGRISDQVYQRFLGRLGSSAMQPMPRYVVSVA